MTATLARAAGPMGMVGGQVLDMAGENRALGVDGLREIHSAKTGALITAAVVLGGLASAETGEDDLSRLERYGTETGMAFQIVDDILDETGETATLGKRAGADRDAGKSTYPAAIGLDSSRRLAARHLDAALAAVDGLPGNVSALASIARRIVERTH